MNEEEPKRPEPTVTAESKDGWITVLSPDKTIYYHYKVDYGVWLEKLSEQWRYSKFRAWNALKKAAIDWRKEKVGK